MKNILITGATGFFGNAFVRTLLGLDRTERIVVYSRSEFRQFQMAKELEIHDPHHKLRWFIGDVRDRDRLRRAMEDVETVVHAAALKRIEVGFYNPIEMVKTNVDGAVNVIEAAHDAGVKKVVALSSDKAFEPVSPYGQTKALAEALFLAANNIRGWRGPRFAACRYGNVWGSTGSVVPTWRALLARGETELPVTDPECTRFFMKIEEAVQLVVKTIVTMKGGELAIPALPAYRLGDLAEAFGAKTKVTGLPSFEKRHEGMSPGNTSDKARRMSVQELKDALRE